MSGTERLSLWLQRALGAQAVEVTAVRPLSGGAIQDNRLVEAAISGGPQAGRRAFVLRKDAPATIAASHRRREEFALMTLAHEGGVTTPRPIAFCEEEDVAGGPFALMEKVEGVGFGPRVVKDLSLGGDREALGERLGRELARIHRLRPAGEAFAFLGRAPERPAQAAVDQLRLWLDQMRAARPATEWALRWCELSQPPCPRPVLCHHDFRTGNVMLDEQGLTAILDWEFAGWGDPHMDIGWFTAKCWRFSRPDLEGGGICSRAAFYRGYESEAGAAVDHEAVLFWEVMAHLRWGVIALQQGARHLSGAEPSLALALTGRMIAELEAEALALTAPARWSA